jgi:membrane protein involved in colicin uptake
MSKLVKNRSNGLMLVQSTFGKKQLQQKEDAKAVKKNAKQVAESELLELVRKREEAEAKKDVNEAKKDAKQAAEAESELLELVRKREEAEAKKDANEAKKNAKQAAEAESELLELVREIEEAEAKEDAKEAKKKLKDTKSKKLSGISSGGKKSLSLKVSHSKCKNKKSVLLHTKSDMKVH